MWKSSKSIIQPIYTQMYAAFALQNLALGTRFKFNKWLGTKSEENELKTPVDKSIPATGR